MKKHTIILIIIIILIAIFVIVQDDSTDEPTLENDTQNAAKEIGSDSEIPQNESRYQIYSPEKLASADEGNVVLNFSATWCPSCRALEKGINNNLDEIPEDLTILKVDYDSNIELRKKYGVKTQHTLVQVDSNGDAITMWSGGSTLDSIISKLQ